MRAMGNRRRRERWLPNRCRPMIAPDILTRYDRRFVRIRLYGHPSTVYGKLYVDEDGLTFAIPEGHLALHPALIESLQLAQDED